MNRFIKIAFILIVVGTFSCKNKERGTLSNYDANPKNIKFKNKFHEANSEKMIGHYDKSILLFNECLVIKPKSAVCYFGLSEIYLKLKDSNKSLEYAQKAVDLNVGNKWYLIHLADIYHSVGNYHQSATNYLTLFKQFNEKNIDYRYKLVDALIFTNQHEKAIDQLNIVELETGKTAHSSLTKHDLYNKLNKPDQADQEIELLLNEFPDSEGIRNTILDYYLQTNQIEKAKSIANDILEINPNNGNAYLGLADIEIRSNNIDKSFNYLEKGFRADNVEPDRKMTLLNGLTSYAFDKRDPNSIIINKRLKTLYQISEIKQSNNPSFLMLYGTYLSMNNKHNEARERFAQSCAIDPSDYRAWDGLLNANYSAKLFDSLYYDSKKAIDVFPTQPMVYLLAGIGAYETKKHDEAEEFLILGSGFVIKDNEMNSEFQYHLGKNYWKSGDKKEGKIYFNKALVTYPNNAKVYNGYALLLKEDGRIDDALESIKKAIEIDNLNPLYFDLYGQILLIKKKFLKAENEFEKAILLDYTNYKILENYGDALYLNGKIDNAVEMWIESKNKGNLSKTIDKKIIDKKLQ
jgi:tetratricopeptide (TPR) repeat protein